MHSLAMLKELQNSLFLHIFISSWQLELEFFEGWEKKEEQNMCVLTLFFHLNF